MASGKTLWTAAGAGVVAIMLSPGGVGTAQVPCQDLFSNGNPEDCDPGDLCLVKNDPEDGYVSNPKNAHSDYLGFCWTGTGSKIEDNTTFSTNKWSVSVILYENRNYNSGDPGGYGCFRAEGSKYNLQYTTYANVNRDMNDELSSNRNRSGTSSC